MNERKRVAIAVAGDEILRNEIRDTNGEFLSRELQQVGFMTSLRAAAPDDETALARLIGLMAEQADVVLLCGGLGATPDDCTREAVCRFTGLPLVTSEPHVRRVEHMYRGWGAPLPENAYRQAQAPAGARLLENPVGTAVGFLCQHEGTWIAALPGVPAEMERMFAESLLPALREAFPDLPATRRTEWSLYGVTEAEVGAVVGALPAALSLRHGVYVSAGTIRVVLESPASADTDAVSRALSDLRGRLAPWIYAEAAVSPFAALAASLRNCGWEVAVVEAASRGTLGHALADEGVLSEGRLYGHSVGQGPERLLQSLMADVRSDCGIAVGYGETDGPAVHVPVIIGGPWGMSAKSITLPVSIDSQPLRMAKATAIMLLQAIREWRSGGEPNVAET